MVTSDDQLLSRLRDDDPPPGTLIGEFRVEGKLGEGGMASVHAAVHPVIGKRAAVKVIAKRLCADLHAVERFLEEARAVHRIGHPNIVDNFAFGTLPDGRAYFMMEWLQGESLAARIVRGPLALAEALEILLQICDAVEAAHEKGVIHRDLKPDNVFVVETRDRPFVKVLDFGLAKLADADVTLPRSRSRSGVGVGTAGYMSPEQARGKTVDGATDVYAIGAMTFQMVLGRLPFEGESAIDILAKHLAEPVPSPRALWPAIPGPLAKLIVAMLDKEAARRPSLAEVRQVLTQLRQGPLPERSLARRTRGWALPAALVVAGGVATAGTVWRTTATPPSPPKVVAAQPPPIVPVAPNVPVALPKTGTLIVHATPKADVMVDGNLAADGAMELAGGRHQMSVSAPKYRTVQQLVEVKPGEKLELEVRLEPQKKDTSVKKHPAATTQKGDYTLDPFE